MDLSGDGGVLKKVTVAAPPDAEGPPPAGDDVQAHYTGTLHPAGTKFDSSRDRDAPFKFRIGEGQVIKGWDVGFAAMRVGERATLRCRSDYAYGENGALCESAPGVRSALE